ncbi:protein SRC2 homolog [Typha angustifolia]|uniref:protein SRC2 homolog n=1 Tax=Typha angustifolia TaxID=59011 RepID=UPI003C2E1495
MGSRYEVEITIGSARDLKNVNWRHGDLKPYAVAWVDGGAKCSTKADLDNDVSPVWDEKLSIPLPPDRRLEEAVLYVDVVHAKAAEGVKPLVGSARIPIREVLDDVGVGAKSARSLKLKRPSGRPQGKLEVKITIKQPARYYDRYAPPQPYAQSAPDRRGEGSYGGYGYSEPARAGYPYAPPAPSPAAAGYPYAPPMPASAAAGYPYAPPAPASAGYQYGGSPYGQASGYGSAPYGQTSGYGSAPYGQTSGYGSAPYGQTSGYGSAPAKEKKSKFGMGTGLAVGAAAGVLGGLALAEGVDYVEDKIADDAAEKVEDNLGYDDGGFGDYGGDDF